MCFEHFKFKCDFKDTANGSVCIKFLGVDCSDLGTASFLHSVFLTYMKDENFFVSREISWMNAEDMALYFKPWHRINPFDDLGERKLICLAKKGHRVLDQIELSYQQVAMLNTVLQKAINTM